MKLVATELDGVAIIESPVFSDVRGAFWESHHIAKFNELGLTQTFKQDAVSRSRKDTSRAARASSSA